MRNKILIAVILFLIAGVYIDVKMMPKEDGICIKEYRQRALIVQTIVPFRPERETFYLGIGNRHYDHLVTFTHYVDRETDELLGTKKSEYGCAVHYQELKERGISSFLREYTHYFNLNNRPVQEVGIVKTEQEIRKVTREDYEKWYK